MKSSAKKPLGCTTGRRQVRGVWVLAGTGTESHDKFRKTLPGARGWDRLGWFMTSISRMFSMVWLAKLVAIVFSDFI